MKSTNNKSTKKLIIDKLSTEFPLPLKQIYLYIKSRYNVSYQAVHKALNELIEDKIVEKINKQYYLNKDWVNDQTGFFSKTYTNYFNVSHNPNEIDPSTKIQVFKFYSLKDIHDFVVESYVKDRFGKCDEVYVFLRRLHPIIPNVLVKTIKQLTKRKRIYILCRSNGLADKWTARFLRSIGANVKTGVKIPHQNAMCIGDCLLQYFFFFPESYKKKVHEFADKFKSSLVSKMIKLASDIFYRRAEMYLILNRYPVFVNDMKETMNNEFKIKKVKKKA